MSIARKIVLLCHFGVGKTSLVRRYVEDAFSEDYLVTLGVQLKKKTVTIDGHKVSLIIWDIEGKTEVQKTRSSYLMGTHGVVYVFDISRPETYENIETELAHIQKILPNAPINVVANKSDLFTATFNEKAFSKPPFKDCFFCSAKTGENVAKVFESLAKKTI